MPKSSTKFTSCQRTWKNLVFLKNVLKIPTKTFPNQSNLKLSKFSEKKAMLGGSLNSKNSTKLKSKIFWEPNTPKKKRTILLSALTSSKKSNNIGKISQKATMRSKILILTVSKNLPTKLSEDFNLENGSTTT